MICVIPLRDGHLLRPEVYKSLAMQTVQLFIMPITRPVIEGDIGPSNYLSQAATRNVAADLIRERHRCINPNLSLWHVADAVIWNHQAVEMACKLFSYDDTLGAVYINVGHPGPQSFSNKEHYDFASVVVRNEALSNVSFRSIDNECNCRPFKEDMIKSGWRVQWLSTEPMGCKINKYQIEKL